MVRLDLRHAASEIRHELQLIMFTFLYISGIRKTKLDRLERHALCLNLSELNDLCFVVRKAKNGKEAIDILNSSAELPGLVCLDLMMPIMDGQKFLIELQFKKSVPRCADLPILVISAARAQVEGSIVGRLKKPPDIEELLGFAEKYCRIS